ncbi:MAG: outer membrane protein assembly factor BamB [Legionellales bacterium RIFCSPHIGHO2_12_FULL_42_9]|nr:MAG: outer membrane protein assembly factor BamB [Legionellales bacterium RIFCSPHIGHO2_12_FULL_42_9]
MKKCVVMLLVCCLSSCAKFDDYMLGKDNSPVPKQLKSLDSQITMTKKWTVLIGKGQKNSAYFRLKPLLSGNTLFVADIDGRFDAINKNTGKIIWSHKTPYAFISGPTIGQGTLIVSTNKSQIVAYSAKDGHQLWHQKLSGDVLASPIIAKNQVIAKTIDGNLYSFNAQSGEKRWQLEHGSPSLVLKASSSPVMMNGHTALIGYSDGKLDAVDIDTGHVLWQRSIVYATGSSDVERLVDIDADPIISGNNVFLGSYQGSVGGVSLENGQFIWQRPASIFKNMILKDNTLYFTDSHDVIWAINKQNGQVNWKQPALKARNLTEPALKGNRLFVGDQTGLLHGLDTSTGQLIMRAPIKGAVYVAPLISGKQIFVLTAAGELSCYRVS